MGEGWLLKAGHWFKPNYFILGHSNWGYWCEVLILHYTPHHKGIGMIAEQVSVTRRCEYCQKTRLDIEPFLYLSINHAAGIIQRSNKQCANCHRRDLTIVRIQLKILEGWIYGDPNRGHWKCPSHPTMYYPAAMKQAVEERHRWDYNQLTRGYVEIAENGFPWRCPICEEEMYYFDERESEVWMV